MSLVATMALGLLAAPTGVGSTSAAPSPDSRPDCASSVPYTAGEGGYDTYRIPAVLTTRAGTVLAFAEGRHDGAGDSGHIDVVLRRPTDGGCTWGPPLGVRQERRLGGRAKDEQAVDAPFH